MRISLTTLCLLFLLHLKAQEPDSLRVSSDSLSTRLPDSALVAQKKKTGFVRRFFTKDYPKPGRAALLSLIVPGAGQAYNKRWWKLPIVYGTLGALLWVEIDNIKQYRELRDNHRWLVDEDPNTNPTKEPYTRIDATSMKIYRDQWRRYVELSSLFLGLAYIMQITDAFVDAHLRRFDVSDDLSLRFQPKLEPTAGFGTTVGFGVSLRFGTERPRNITPAQFP